MTINQVPAHWVKRPDVYLVIADDRDPFTTWAEHMREDRIPERRVVHVERQADHPVERELQWDELMGSVLDAGSESLSLLALRAVSHAHAAGIARLDYALFNAAARMVEVIDRHLEGGGHGWVAIRIADGGSDGELYDGDEAARAAQQDPDGCTYFPISTPWTPRMCRDHLEFMTHKRHGCLVYGSPTCR
ncbi:MULTISPECIES: hypothetical protein [unclassified Streptomyces]|uniref:hypothetical protein n=1 Tax=unclassified Streptomyces TaxID=2593676 RepID=UPI0007499F98|nr:MULTISPECIES: hypothetical protein [unclassified Streptomyces]KUL73944.1 hypothetical protein ADL34_18960 [Streptomyces sp. NRRL WC-3605]KUL74339.1 hypothetical protein ADL33_17730 [Streptomyces sp. NRRL WC-3604]